MMDIKKLRIMARMTQREFAEYFNIPKRTIENWEGGKRTPPVYLVELIKYKIEKERLGMLRLVEKNHGKEKVLMEGYLHDIVQYLKDNDKIYTWILDNDIVQYLKDNDKIYTWILDEDKGMELPNLDEIKTLRDLEVELEKIDLDWWTLEVKEM